LSLRQIPGGRDEAPGFFHPRVSGGDDGAEPALPEAETAQLTSGWPFNPYERGQRWQRVNRSFQGKEKTMRPFIDERKTSTQEEVGSTITNSYIALEWPIDDSRAFVVYLIPRNTHSVFVATCWEHAFDQLLQGIDEDTAETIGETWPTLAALLYNGADDLYREGALILLEDFDDGERKWFLASVVGNISFENVEGLLGERTDAVMQLVAQKSVQLLTELNENEPSTLRAIGKGVAQAVGTGLMVGLLAVLGVDPDELLS
jgi:hypothetical protein